MMETNTGELSTVICVEGIPDRNLHFIAFTSPIDNYIIINCEYVVG